MAKRATYAGQRKATSHIGFLAIGQVGHLFSKSIEKKNNHKSLHFTPANLAKLAKFASLGQRKTQQELQDVTT